MIHPLFHKLAKTQLKLLRRKNKINHLFYNGIVNRYCYPVFTRHHIPLEWRFDLRKEENHFFMERLGINATFNPGAIYYNHEYYLILRIEGVDRKSFFALAKSPNGIDNFQICSEPIIWADIDPEEVNMYDMRLVHHEDGYIYGIYCSESKAKGVDESDTSSAIAKAGLVRTSDLINWERLPNLQTPSNQQRNVVLHPEFIDRKYAFYTRPQDGFVETGTGGGICIGFCDDITNPIIKGEIIIDEKRYHTNYELKNGQGPAPLKTHKGWIHLAHGVRYTAAGLRYILYIFATSLIDPTKVIAKPSGYLLAPQDDERLGDVSNVLFCNGWIVDEKDNVFIYYASSDTRVHVATTTLERLIDYTFLTPSEEFRSLDCAKQRLSLIQINKLIKEKKGGCV